jgi:excisionase family DNA binding protein
MAVDKPEELLTGPEAAVLLQVTSETVRRWAKERKLAHLVLPSGQLRYRRADVLAAIREVAVDAEVAS